jgi:UDP-glucose 4-epimerase
VLVTGAAGFIGSHLTGRLVANGAAVRGVDDERSGDWSRCAPQVEQTTAALEKLSVERLQELCDGVDVVYHLAAQKLNSPRATPETIAEVNVLATQRLYASATRTGVRKMVFTSSLYAYGGLGPEAMSEADVPRPSTHYGVSKLAGEHLLRVAERDDGLRWTVARLFFVYGPNQYAEGGYKSVIVTNFERLSRGERPIVHGDGEQALDYVYVDDCIDALVAMATPEHDGATYNVASGRGVSVNELTRAMLAVADSEAEPLHDAPDWTHGTRRVGTTDAAARSLGWVATTPLDQGLGLVWEWMSSG